MTIDQLKAYLREFIALSETITPGKWETKDDLAANCGYHFVNTVSSPLGTIVAGRKEDADFIARSRNISPTMAKMLLESINGLEYISKSPSNEGVDAEETINRILKLWEETK